MRILFDAGNTYLKCGIFENEMLYFDSLSNEHVENKLIGFIAEKTKEFSINPKTTQCYLVSVNQPISHKVFKVLKCMGFSVEKFSKKMNIGFKTLYESPTLGDDRIVTDYGAYKLYGGKLIVIDLGTAATFDLLDESGTHLGGSIMPGKETYQYSLLKTAKVLPEVSIPFAPYPIGTSTITNLESGLFYGFIGSVLHMIDVIKSREEFSDYKVVLTGGDTELFYDNDKIDLFDKELTLKGLNEIYNERTKSNDEHK